MICSFDNLELERDLEIQLKDYCLSLVEGSCAVQKNQITLFYDTLGAALFSTLKCSDIIEIILDEPEGNRQLYKYNSIEIWVYQVVD